jgi:hypothetical protein
MSKTVEISDEAAALFQKVVERGSFPDTASAIEDSPRQLDFDEYDKEFEASLVRAIEQIERGEGREFTRDLSLKLLVNAKGQVEA